MGHICSYRQSPVQSSEGAGEAQAIASLRCVAKGLTNRHQSRIHSFKMVERPKHKSSGPPYQTARPLRNKEEHLDVEMMETRRGQHDEQQHLVPGKKKTTTMKKKKKGDDGVATGACLRPAAVLPDASSARHHALEQELLFRADLLQLQPPRGSLGGDRRGERRMKNRASAERSRARRLAYMSELEAAVHSLRQENEELKRLCEELKEAAEAQMPPVKKTATARLLQRTSSSPF